MNERVDTEGTAHLEQSYREKMDMQTIRITQEN
jgi:hypothetical protein